MSRWKVHIPTENNRIAIYKCGLRAGQFVTLKKSLMIRDDLGQPTGTVHEKDERWEVLPGITTDPVLWFLPPNGKSCTWDDDVESVSEWFEVAASDH